MPRATDEKKVERNWTAARLFSLKSTFFSKIFYSFDNFYMNKTFLKCPMKIKLEIFSNFHLKKINLYIILIIGSPMPMNLFFNFIFKKKTKY